MLGVCGAVWAIAARPFFLWAIVRLRREGVGVGFELRCSSCGILATAGAADTAVTSFVSEQQRGAEQSGGSVIFSPTGFSPCKSPRKFGCFTIKFAAP